MKRKFKFLLATLPLLLAAPLFAQLSFSEIPYDSAPNLLKMPDNTYLGEVAGVATNSKGHIFVYTRTGSENATLGTNRVFVRTGSRLFEFDQTGKYVREIGEGLYGFVFASSVKVDPQDNIWVVDIGSNMVIKFDPDGRHVMNMGRKPEDIRIPAPPSPAAGAPPIVPVAGDNFNRPTDVAWDAAGDIFVADGAVNSRVAKFDKNGVYVKSWGTKGSGQSQFNALSSIAVDAKDNVYVGDRGNRRIQVFDSDGNFKTQFLNAGNSRAICITAGSHQYLYSSNSNGVYSMEDGEIYKMELDGTIVGKFGQAGKLMKDFGTVNEIDCRNENEIYVGEIGNWRVQKLTLHARGPVAKN
jgi:sugar lactone lactonase YvrE